MPILAPQYALFLHSGGPDGELGASMRYLNQRYTMPYQQTKGILTDVGTEESAPSCYISSSPCLHAQRDIRMDPTLFRKTGE